MIGIIGILLVVAVSSIVNGYFCAYIAQEKGREKTLWFWLGILFPPIALVSIAGLPSRKTQSISYENYSKICPYCAESIKKAAVICRYCQKQFPKDSEADGGINASKKAELMERYGIIYSSLRYHVGERRFTTLEDAVNYVVSRSEQQSTPVMRE